MDLEATVADNGGRDFFLSYTQVNRPWAEWIAVQLQADRRRAAATAAFDPAI